MKFSSGKKLKFIIFGLLLVVAIGFLASRTSRFQYGTTGILSADNLNDKTYAKALNNVTKKDSDNDGLKDWEEELWGTDPNNPDTDGDGTKDGEEVSANRNPLVAGPDDELNDDISILSRQNYSIDESAELTATDKFAQKFFQNYLLLRSSGGQLSEDGKINLINTSVYDIEGTYTSSRNYAVSDLNISDDISSVAARNYGNILGGIILKHSFETENELEIFNRSIVNDDTEEIKKLDPIIEGYKKILRDALVVAVPQDATGEHITFIESIDSIIVSIENMRAVYSDPIRAIAGIGGHEQSVLLLTNAFQSLESYFIKKDVTFERYDKGLALINTI